MRDVERAFSNLVLREILLAGNGDLIKYLQIDVSLKKRTQDYKSHLIDLERLSNIKPRQK